MKDGAEKTQLSIDLLGPKLGPKLIPFLNQGGKAIENYKGILKSFNALVTNEGVKAADAAGDELAVIGFLFGQYRNVFTSLIAPGITKASDAILGAIAENSTAILDETVRRTHVVRVYNPDNQNIWVDVEVIDSLEMVGMSGIYTWNFSNPA